MVEAFNGVSKILERRYPVTYFVTYYEPENRAWCEFEDDGFIHIQRGDYRYVFYKKPQGSLSDKDIDRFAKGVDKVIRTLRK